MIVECRLQNPAVALLSYDMQLMCKLYFVCSYIFKYFSNLTISSREYFQPRLDHILRWMYEKTRNKVLLTFRDTKNNFSNPRMLKIMHEKGHLNWDQAETENVETSFMLICEYQ